MDRRRRLIVLENQLLPSDLSGLVSWYDASDITTLWQDSARTTPVTSDGDVVGAIDDKSGNSNHILQATTANKPLYKAGIQNSLSVVRFDDIDDYMQVVYTIDQPLTRIAIANTNNTGDRIADGGNAIVQLYRSTNWFLRASTNLDSGIAADSNKHIFICKINGTSSQLIVDGVGGTTGDAGAVDAGGITFGATFINSNNMDGDICEVTDYNRILTDSEISQLTASLNAKWAVY